MSKTRWPSVALGVGLAVLLNSCGSSTDAPSDVASLTLDTTSTSTTLLVGNTTTLKANVVGKFGALSDATVSWRSSAPNVADVSGQQGLQAQVTGKSPGTATISATAGGQSASATIRVTNIPVASVSIGNRLDTIGVGATKQLAALAHDSAGGALSDRQIGWTSLNTNIATVDGTGTVTAKTLGVAQIVATCETKSDTAAVTVTPGAVATITISPPSLNLFAGDTSHFQVVLMDAADDVLSDRTVTWTSSDTTVAAVASLVANNAIGSVRAVAKGGPVTVTATSEGKSMSATVQVRPVPLPPTASVRMVPSALTLPVGASGPVTATPRDSLGNAIVGRTLVWVSGDPTIATVAATGSSAFVGAVKIGTTTVTATSDDGISGTTAVTVSAPAPVTLTVAGVLGTDTEGNGTVNSVPAGISCTITQGIAGASGCSAAFAPGQTVTLTAQPQALGAQPFGGWGGACGGNATLTCVLVMNTSTQTSASFQTIQYLFRVGNSGEGDPGGKLLGTGSVTVSPAGLQAISCSPQPYPACRRYAAGEVVVATAVPDSNSRFVFWEGGCVGSPCSMTVNGPVDLTANWLAPVPQVTTLAASSITNTSATLLGSVTLAGIRISTQVWFAWGTSPASLANKTTIVTINSDMPNFGAPITVAPNTTYYYQLVASNMNGVGSGTVQQFTSKP